MKDTWSNDEILDEIAWEYGQSKTKGAQDSLARLAFRIASGGLPPFPSQMTEVKGKLWARFEIVRDRRAKEIEASIKNALR